MPSPMLVCFFISAAIHTDVAARFSCILIRSCDKTLSSKISVFAYDRATPFLVISEVNVLLLNTISSCFYDSFKVKNVFLVVLFRSHFDQYLCPFFMITMWQSVKTFTN